MGQDQGRTSLGSASTHLTNSPVLFLMVPNISKQLILSTIARQIIRM